MADDRSNGAGGHLAHYYRFTNTSTTTCLLGGHPRVVASETAHPDLVATNGTFFGDGGPPGDVAPNGWSQLIIQTVSTCATNPGGASGAIYHHVVVTLPGGGNMVIPGASFDGSCGLSVTSFAWPLPSPTVLPDPIAALKVTLAAPQRLYAGTTAVYAVMLANPTHAAVAFDRCPNFIQVLQGTTVKDVHQLNCPQAKPIPAHGQEAFVMHLVVPDDAASGQTTLAWNLVAPGVDSASALVEVQADRNRPVPGPVPGSPPPCSGSGVGQPPPCGPGVMLNVAYPYALYTHCGVPTIVLDGQRWQPIAKTDTSGDRAPYGWGDPIETGTITVDKPGAFAHFDGAPGHRVDFSGPNAQTASPSLSC